MSKEKVNINQPRKLEQKEYSEHIFHLIHKNFIQILKH